MSDSQNSAIRSASAETIEEHPSTKWTYWYYEYVDGTSWEENLKHIVKPHDFNRGCNYSMFKGDIKPTKEDPRNINGGQWVTTLNPDFEPDDEVENVWVHVCFGVVEDPLGDNDNVNGLTLDIKGNEYTIACWVKDSSNEKAVLEIREVLGDIIGQYWPASFEFIEHKA